MENPNHADPASAQKPADHTEAAPAQTAAEDKIASLEKTVNGLAAVIRKLQAKPESEATQPQKKGVDDELKARLDKLDKRAAITAKNATRQAARTAFLDAGIASDAIDDAVDLFLARHGAQANYDDETDTVLVKTSEIDEPLSVKDFIAQQAKSGAYNRYKAAKATPTKGGTGQAGRSSDGRLKFATLADYAAAASKGGIDHTKVDIG